MLVFGNLQTLFHREFMRILVSEFRKETIFVSTSQFLWPTKEKVYSAYLSNALECCVFPRDVDIRGKKAF